MIKKTATGANVSIKVENQGICYIRNSKTSKRIFKFCDEAAKRNHSSWRNDISLELKPGVAKLLTMIVDIRIALELGSHEP